MRDQDIQPAIGRHRLGDQIDPFRLIGDVDLRGRSLPVTDADVGGDGISITCQDIGDNDLGALRREQPRFGFAHAMSGAGDDRNFVLQTHDRPRLAGPVSIPVQVRCSPYTSRRHDRGANGGLD
jgi:hypothetical protein